MSAGHRYRTASGSERGKGRTYTAFVWIGFVFVFFCGLLCR